jgi:hypothetical protein
MVHSGLTCLPDDTRAIHRVRHVTVHWAPGLGTGNNTSRSTLRKIRFGRVIEIAPAHLVDTVLFQCRPSGESPRGQYLTCFCRRNHAYKAIKPPGAVDDHFWKYVIVQPRG